MFSLLVLIIASLSCELVHFKVRLCVHFGLIVLFHLKNCYISYHILLSLKLKYRHNLLIHQLSLVARHKLITDYNYLNTAIAIFHWWVVQLISGKHLWLFSAVVDFLEKISNYSFFVVGMNSSKVTNTWSIDTRVFFHRAVEMRRQGYDLTKSAPFKHD